MEFHIVVAEAVSMEEGGAHCIVSPSLFRSRCAMACSAFASASLRICCFGCQPRVGVYGAGCGGVLTCLDLGGPLGEVRRELHDAVHDRVWEAVEVARGVDRG